MINTASDSSFTDVGSPDILNNCGRRLARSLRTTEHHSKYILISRQVRLIIDVTFNSHSHVLFFSQRNYALTNALSGVKLIWDMGHDIFRRHLEAGPDVEVQSKILTGLLHSIELFRCELNTFRSISVIG